MLFYFCELFKVLLFIGQPLVFGVKLLTNFIKHIFFKLILNLRKAAFENSITVNFYFHVYIHNGVECLKSKVGGFPNKGVIK